MEQKKLFWIFILLVLFVGVVPQASFVLEWFIKNVLTPIGTLEDIAWAIGSPNPWIWVFRLMMLAIAGSVVATAVSWIRRKIDS